MTRLYDYQRKGILKIEEFHGRALLADEMGLGKTLEALGWIRHHPKKRPVIIVCPAFAKWVWEMEAHKHLKMKSIILNGKKSFRINQKDSINSLLILNYEILQYWMDNLLRLEPKVLLFDECHYVKNRKTHRTKAVRKLARKIPHVIAIGGTPLLNRPAELWTTLNMIRPKLFPSFLPYAFRYCNPIRTPWGWDFNGASHLDELHQILNETMMIRRLKKDVLKELPKKSRFIVPLSIDNRNEYQEAVNNFIDWLSRKSLDKAKRAQKAEQLVKIGYLKRLAAQLKMKSILKWIDNFLEESDDKLVLYCIHKNIIKQIYDKYKKISVVVDGSVTGEKRKKAVLAFQNNKKIKLFIGSIKAAGVVITLTASNTLAFVELDFVPANHIQAEDRIHRIGQKYNASIYYLIAKNTIEVPLCALIQKKQKIVDSVLDGDNITNELNIFDKLEKILKKGLVE